MRNSRAAIAAGWWRTARRLAPAGCLWLLAACATPAIPQGYDGPRAVITDTAVPRGRIGADHFMLIRIDGRDLSSSTARFARTEYPADSPMMPVTLEREVPAQAAVFALRGRTVYRTPALSFGNDVYQITGEVAFAPQPGRRYLVRGEMNDSGSAIWVEDAESGTLMGSRIAVAGKSTLGILEK